MKKIPDYSKIYVRAIGKGLNESALRFIGLIQAEEYTGRPGLKVRTGTLRKSWLKKLELRGETFQSTVYTNNKYARPHEYGTTIKHPGGTPYVISVGRNGQPEARWLRKDGLLPAKVRYTKAHDIPMPKRTHVRERLKKDGPPIYKNGITKHLRKDLGGAN